MLLRSENLNIDSSFYDILNPSKESNNIKNPTRTKTILETIGGIVRNASAGIIPQATAKGIAPTTNAINPKSKLGSIGIINGCTNIL